MTRKSKHELEQTVDDLEGDDPAVAGWITLIRAARTDTPIEPVPGAPDRVRIGGEVKRLDSQVRNLAGGDGGA